MQARKSAQRRRHTSLVGVSKQLWLYLPPSVVSLIAATVSSSLMHERVLGLLNILSRSLRSKRLLRLRSLFSGAVGVDQLVNDLATPATYRAQWQDEEDAKEDNAKDAIRARVAAELSERIEDK